MSISPIEPIDEDIVELGTEFSAMPWSSRNESLFIQLMDDEVKAMAIRQTGTFTKQAFGRIRDEMIARTKYKYTSEQLRNKYNQLRILFNKFNQLKSQTGVGWDNNLLTITASDDVWERLFKVNSHARRFKKKGMPHYAALCRIFGDTSASGTLRHPSCHAPSSTDSSDPDLKTQGDEVEMDSSPCINRDKSMAKSTGMGKSKEKEKGKGQGSSGTMPKTRKRDSFAANISDALNEFNATGKRKLELMEMKLLSQSSAATTSVPTGSASAASEQPRGRLMKECMDALSLIPDIEGPAYAKVLEKLYSDVLWREIFLQMPEHMRKIWISNL